MTTIALGSRVHVWFRGPASGSTLLAAASWSCSRSSDLPAPPKDSGAALAGAAGLPQGDATDTGAAPAGGANGAGGGTAAGHRDDAGLSGNAPGGADVRGTVAAGGAAGADADGPDESDDPFEVNTPTTACDTNALDLERKPRLVVFVLDTAASMDEPVASGENRTKWDTVATVLRATFETRDPALAVGLVFLPAAGDTGGEVIALPGSERDDMVHLVDGEPEYSPRGMLSAFAFAARTSSEKDGPLGCPVIPIGTAPSGCQGGAAGAACTGDASVPCPFGVGTTVVMQSICQTDLVDSVALEAALAKAVADDMRCLYRVPAEDRIQNELGANVFPDYDSVTLKYYPDGGSTAVALVRRPAGNQFGPESWDWQYVGDELDAIHLPASTCQTVMGDPDGRLVLELGCVLGI